MDSTHHEVRTRFFTAMWDRPFSGGWFRLFGWGIGVVDHRKTRMFFSERYNGQHGVKKRIYVHLGPWCFKGLQPTRKARTYDPERWGDWEESVHRSSQETRGSLVPESPGTRGVDPRPSDI